MKRRRTKAELIPADEYPPLLPKTQRAMALRALRSDETLAAANTIIAMRAGELRGAVSELIGRMKEASAAKDATAAYAAAHEIRGLAGTAGLDAAGRMANGLCRYLDEIARRDLKPDDDVMALHVDAIARAVQIADDAVRHGDAVVRQLSRLVANRLARIKNSETP